MHETGFKIHDLTLSVIEDERQIMGTESSSIVSNKKVCHVSLRMLEGEDQAGCFPLRQEKLYFRKFCSE